jgi:hypothetical protein
MTVTRARDGWTLHIEKSPPGSRFVNRTWLDGLAVTREQAHAIITAGGAERTWTLAGYHQEWPAHVLILDRVGVTREEYLAILGGRDPVSVLLPLLRARALTLAEMMAQ